jgi:hypothetical protein
VLGANPTLYSAEEVLLSANANILFATTRYTEHLVVPDEASSYPYTEDELSASRSSRPMAGSSHNEPDLKPNVGDDERQDRQAKTSRRRKRSPQPGYITAILLTSLLEEQNPLQGRLVGSGFPIRVLFQLATTTTGGLANSVSPAPWANNYFALADSQYGMIEVSSCESKC